MPIHRSWDRRRQDAGRSKPAVSGAQGIPGRLRNRSGSTGYYATIGTARSGATNRFEEHLDAARPGALPPKPSHSPRTGRKDAVGVADARSPQPAVGTEADRARRALDEPHSVPAPGVSSRSVI